MKCSSCVKQAYYEYHVTAEFKVPYCSTCVPGFLKSPKHSGLLKRVDVFVPPTVIADVPKPKAPKKPKVEEFVVEEPVVDLAPEVVDEPATIEDDASN